MATGLALAGEGRGGAGAPGWLAVRRARGCEQSAERVRAAPMFSHVTLPPASDATHV